MRKGLDSHGAPAIGASSACQPATTPAPVVITGGAGFLGTNIADRLAAEGEQVVIVDNLSRDRVGENVEWLTSRHPRRISVEVIDVREADALRGVVRNARAVIHLAAQVAVTTSVRDPVDDFEVNARGTLNVLEAVRAVAPTAPLVFASTNKVYGELIPRPQLQLAGDAYAPVDPQFCAGMHERTPLSFHSPYGCSKGVADQYVLDYARVYGLRTTVFRMSCLYGPHQFGTEDQGWVAHFMIAALGGRPITIFGDGCQVRDVLYVEDAVAAYRAAILGGGDTVGRAFNLGGGPANTLSLRQLIALLPEFTGRAPEVRHAPWRPGDQAWYVSDTTALTDATGWGARVGVKEGLARLAAWLRSSEAQSHGIAAAGVPA